MYDGQVSFSSRQLFDKKEQVYLFGIIMNGFSIYLHQPYQFHQVVDGSSYASKKNRS